MKIFFSVGEPSGDLHGANLIRELRRRRPDCEFVGYGGPRMAAAGCDAARRPHQAGRDVVPARAAEHSQVLEPRQPGRPLLPPPSAGRGRADRLSRLQLVDRPAGQGPWHSGVLLRRAAAVGVGRLADQEDAAVRRSRAVQVAVRRGLVPRARLQRDVRRPSVFRSTADRAARCGVHRTAAGRRAGRWWRSCPARARRK